MQRFMLGFVGLLLIVNANAGILTGIGAEGGLSQTHQIGNDKTGLLGTGFGLKDWDSHFNAGVSAQFFEYKYFNLNLNFTYNRKGGLKKNGIQSTYVDGNNNVVYGPMLAIWDRLDYISFAPVAKFKYPVWKLEPFFTIGPSFDLFKKYEVSALYGVGVGYRINTHYYGFFEFLHQPGMTYLFSNSNVDWKNDVVKFNLCLLYLL